MNIFYFCMTAIFFFTLGGSFTIFLIKRAEKKDSEKKKKEDSKIYEEALFNLLNGFSKFSNRISETVYIKMNLDGKDAELLWLMDKEVLAVTNNGAIVSASHAIEKELYDKIVKEIKGRYGSDIDNTIEILGMKVNASDLKEKFGPLADMMTGILDQDTFTSDEEGTPTIDELFDKIAENGYDSLSDREKSILEEYRKNLS
jgi:hypothetical protein